MRLPSGAAWTPCPTSIPVISPTTVSVAGSIRLTRSPAEFDWMMMTFPAACSEATASTASSAIPSNRRGRTDDIMVKPPYDSREEQRIFFDLADLDGGLADGGDMETPQPPWRRPEQFRAVI